jgi:hypothetical protein
MSSNQDLTQTLPQRESPKVATWVAAQAKVFAALALVMAVAVAVFVSGTHYGNRWRDEYDAQEYFNTDNVSGCVVGFNCGCIGPNCHYRIPHP